MPAAAIPEWVEQFALVIAPARGPRTHLGRQALRWIVDNAERGVPGWVDAPRPLPGPLH